MKGRQWKINSHMGRQVTPHSFNLQGNYPPRPFEDFPMVSSLIDSENRRWNAELIRSLFLPFEANTILNIPLSYNLPEEKVIWIGNRKGEFTVRSAYYIALRVIESDEVGESSYGDLRTPLWRKMWHLKIPSKIRIFA